MSEFDLRQLNSENPNRIDTTSGKIKRSDTYISAKEAQMRGMNIQGNDNAPDPIFYTPPTFKVNNQSEVQSLDDFPQTTRTPPINDKSIDVPDPVPLKVVDNFAGKFNASAELEEPEEFDIHSLPKKKEEMGDAEAEDMARLDKAVEAEMRSITERVHKLTEAQFDELVEAQQNNQKVTRPMTDEEYAEAEKKRIEAEENKDTPIEEQVQKNFIIEDEDNSETTVVTASNYKEKFEEKCLDIIRYMDNHALSSDYLTRVLYMKKLLAENHHQYSEVWAIVMYNKAGDVKVHPFLAVTHKDVTAILEGNLRNIMGVHVLDPNDSIETLYVDFLHKGYLYEYIDYLDKSAVVKLSSDMPTVENAIKLASEKLGAKTNMTEEIKDSNKNDEPEAIFIESREDVNEPSKLKIDESEIEGAIDREAADYLYNNNDTQDVTVDTPDSNEVETPTDDSALTISKEYDGATRASMNEALSDDLEKDLEKELNIDTDDDDKMLDELKAAVKKNIPAIKRKINLKDFKISDTPISASNAVSFSIRDLNEADWVLPNADRVITVRGLSGPELFAMNPQNSNKSKINTFRQIYGIIYKHIVSKKPSTFDEWLKVTRFSDIDHIYAALHRATFAGSNFVHYECPECNHVFIKEYKFEDMVKYRDDKAESRIHQLLNSANTTIPGYNVKLVQISDNYVVGLKDPSVWNMVMETAALSDNFLSKYEDLLDTMSFIDSIYVINNTSMSLDPIDFGYDKEDPAKSTARKIIVLSDVIKTLSSDSYFNLRTQIAQTFASSNDISYRIPKIVCDKCGHTIDEESTEGVRMLFTRHQLGALGVI